MSTVQLDVRDDVISTVSKISLQKNISIEQFIINAIENEVDLYNQAQYLQSRSNRAKDFNWEAFKSKIPNTPPASEDM